MVYVINAHDCFQADDINMLNSDNAKIRNRLFTAMTRSKAWVRVVGIGSQMDHLKAEYEKVKEKGFTLDFIYPTEEQKILLGKTFGCCRFLYNQMLNDKIQEYKKTKKMLKNTPAMYKKEYTFLKEVDSLALANVQLHLEKAYKNFFRDSKIGFPRFKSKHHSKNSYTTNVVNGNILVESKRIRLPKLKWIAMKKHREPAESLRLKSVTVSMESSEKYFASLLYEGYSCENQAAGPDYSTAKILGIDYAMQGMAVFSEKVETGEAGFFRKNEKSSADNSRKSCTGKVIWRWENRQLGKRSTRKQQRSSLPAMRSGAVRRQLLQKRSP